MVEVDDNNDGVNNMDADEEFWGSKVPGEDDEPDMGMGAYGHEEEEEELVPVKPKRHGGLFGADVDAVKF